MDVGGWLRSLGLGQYEALFRASEIDADILPELTDDCRTRRRTSARQRRRRLARPAPVTVQKSPALNVRMTLKGDLLNQAVRSAKLPC